MFVASNTEIDRHNQRKKRLGFDQFDKEDNYVRRYTDHQRPKRTLKRESRSSKKLKSSKRSDSKSQRKSSPHKQRDSESPKRTKFSNFKTSIYDRARNLTTTRQRSVRKSSKPKLKKVPSERKKKDKRIYKVDDKMKSRVTLASRDGRSTMKSTGQVKAPNDPTTPEEMGMLSCSIHGASKGRMSETSFTRAQPTPKKKVRAKKKKKV